MVRVALSACVDGQLCGVCYSHGLGCGRSGCRNTRLCEKSRKKCTERKKKKRKEEKRRRKKENNIKSYL